MSQYQLSSEEFDQLKGRYDEVAVRSHSINTRCYTEAKFLDIEREQIIHRSWQFLCNEEKLRQPGDYVSAHIEGQSVAGIRSRSGELAAFYNVCKHHGRIADWHRQLEARETAGSTILKI